MTKDESQYKVYVIFKESIEFQIKAFKFPPTKIVSFYTYIFDYSNRVWDCKYIHFAYLILGQTQTLRLIDV